MPRLLAIVLALFCSWTAAQEPEYEMTTYQVAFLKSAPNWKPVSKEESEKLQRAHMAHIASMARAGKLILAGPFSDGGELRGMFIFVGDAAEARRLAEADPAVKAGRLVLEWHPWYSAKGIGILKGEQKK
jgi:uncharacterized protein YciI